MIKINFYCIGNLKEKYLRENIKKNLAQSFLDQWEDKSTSSRNPVSDCEELIAALKKMTIYQVGKKKISGAHLGGELLSYKLKYPFLWGFLVCVSFHFLSLDPLT